MGTARSSPSFSLLFSPPWRARERYLRMSQFSSTLCIARGVRPVTTISSHLPFSVPGGGSGSNVGEQRDVLPSALAKSRRKDRSSNRKTKRRYIHNYIQVNSLACVHRSGVWTFQMSNMAKLKGRSYAAADHDAILFFVKPFTIPTFRDLKNNAIPVHGDVRSFLQGPPCRAPPPSEESVQGSRLARDGGLMLQCLDD